MGGNVLGAGEGDAALVASRNQQRWRKEVATALTLLGNRNVDGDGGAVVGCGRRWYLIEGGGGGGVAAEVGNCLPAAAVFCRREMDGPVALRPCLSPPYEPDDGRRRPPINSDKPTNGREK